jgi:large subunit ribosomal protein L10
MNPDKKVIVDQLLTQINKSPFVLLVDYTGMTVPQFNEIRKRLRGIGSRMHVTKNSYIKAAGASRGFPKELEKDLTGQSAIVYGEADICAAAKTVKTFAAEFQRPALKCGVLDGKFLNGDEVGSLADVGSRENLLAKLLGMFQAPAAAMARVLAARVEKENAPAS